VEAIKEYRQATLPLNVSLSALYKVLAPEEHETSKQHHDFMASDENDGGGFEGHGIYSAHPLQCHILNVRVANKSVDPHNDSGDAPGVMAMWIPFGKYRAGELCFPTLGIKLDVRPGDAIFVRAALIPHAVCRFHGERNLALFTSKSDNDSLVQHVTFMTDPEQIRKLREKRAVDDLKKITARDGKREAEMARIEVFQTLPDEGRRRLLGLIGNTEEQWLLDNKLANIPDHRYRLIKSTTARNARVQTIVKSASLSPIEIFEVESLPFCLFHSVNGKNSDKVSRKRQASISRF